MHVYALILLAVVSVNAETHFYSYPQYQDPTNYFRSGLVASSFVPKADDRQLFRAITLTLATTTSTSIVTVYTTCTTSTTIISTCSPFPGRRRRSAGSENGRGLFYPVVDDDIGDLNIFLPWMPEEVPSAVTEEPKREVREASPPVPFVVQPGFNSPENVRGARFLVSFATSTAITTSTSTYTARLSAICMSSTNFATCAGL